MQGAARHALRQCGANRLARSEAQPPKPAVWKSAAFWPWLLIGLLVIAIPITEILVRVQTSKNEWNLELLEIEYNRRLTVKNEALQTRNEVQGLEATLAEKEQVKKEALRKINILDNVIRYRQEMVPEVLMAIGSAIPEGVLLDELKESGNKAGFQLEGWSLRDTDADLFGKLLNEKLAPWNYNVSNLEVSQGKGRHGVQGYIVKIGLVKSKNQEGGE